MPLRRKKKFILALQPHEASPPTHAAWSPLKSRSLSLGVALFLLMGLAFSFTIPSSQIVWKDSTLNNVAQITNQLWADITPTGTWHYYAVTKQGGGSLNQLPDITPIGFTKKDAKLIKAAMTTQNMTEYWNETSCTPNPEVCTTYETCVPHEDICLDDVCYPQPDTCTNETTCNPQPDTCTEVPHSRTYETTTFTEDNKWDVRLIGIKTDNWEKGSFNPDVSACGALNTSGTYTMNASASINGSTCFTVTAANVTLDCNGWSITGNNSTATYGIYSNQFNTTIKNCNISNFMHGIFFTNGASNGTITNNTLAGSYTNGYGIYLSANSNYNTIANSTITTTGSGRGMTSSNAHYNMISGMTITAPNLGFYMESSNGTVISNSSFKSSNTAGIYLYGSNNNIIANSTINGSGVEAIEFVTTANTNNTFINNTLIAATSAIVLIDATSNRNTFCLNNFTSATTYVQDLNGSNFYNCTYDGKNQGNMWANIINGSVNVSGLVNSSVAGLYIGTFGTGYPYNNVTSGGKFSCNFPNCADNAPLTLNILTCAVTFAWQAGMTPDGLIITRYTNDATTWLAQFTTTTQTVAGCFLNTTAYASTGNGTVFSILSVSDIGNVTLNHTNVPLNNTINLWSVAFLTNGSNITLASRQYYIIGMPKWIGENILGGIFIFAGIGLIYTATKKGGNNV